MHSDSNISEILHSVLKGINQLGIGECEVVYYGAQKKGVGYAQGEVESLTSSEESHLGIRLIKDQRQGFSTTTLPYILPLNNLICDLYARVELLPQDITCGLADSEQFYAGDRSYDLSDHTDWSSASMIDMAASLWHGVMDYSGIDHSSGSSINMQKTQIGYLNSRGFCGVYHKSYYSRGVSAIAGSGLKMEEDYAHDGRLFADDVRSEMDLIQDAAFRAVHKKKPQQIKDEQLEVIFEPRIAVRFAYQIAGALNAGQIVRGTSFLTGLHDQKIAHSEFSLTDDPFSFRAAHASLFDAEGLPRQKNNLIELGYLSNFIMDLSTSRSLGLPPKGQAQRGGLASPPAPGISYLAVKPSNNSSHSMVSSIISGLWVTELIGQGLDIVTGQFSCGVAGIKIENGQYTKAFRNITIAGDMREILLQLRPAQEVHRWGNAEVPALYLGKMTVGK